MKKQEKTNVMRILEKEKIDYNTYYYDHSDNLIDGISVANKMGQDVNTVFKTLVTRSTTNKTKAFYVFVIPVELELNLKKCAKAVGEKAVEMIAVKEINALTGYIRGGCSPIGMKKLFPTVFHSSIQSIEKIIVSGGKIGTQIEVSPAELIKITNGIVADVTD